VVDTASQRIQARAEMMSGLPNAMRTAAFVLAVSATFLAACDSRPTELSLVAPSSPLDLEIAQNLKALLDKESDFRLNITARQQSGEDALDMLLAGKADIALVSNYLPYREGIATVMPLYASVLHIAYRDGRDPSDGYSLLNDANIYAGAEGSASRLMFERIAERIGLPTDAYSYTDLDDSLSSANPDIAVIFAPISPTRMAELDGYKLFSFGAPSDIGSGSIVDAAALLNPQLRPFVIPASTYGAANTGPVVTVAVDKMLVVRNDLNASVVYDLINTIRRSRPALSATRPGLFTQISDDFDVSSSTFVLHAGAQDFLQRAEPTVYERYSGIAEVVVTLMIALASATLAGFRILKIRRKNRIDRFYAAAIEIRNSISGSSTADERTLAAGKIRELQDTAFDQLVDEKLSADESFRIFVTLSNDVLDQLAV
jgi:TRAP-type uncharacterized transport system substrate-binding protein